MEKCLQIPEILRYVCDELDTESCLSAALTSRTFLEPALDRLWYHVDSMRPLICCLPVGVGIFKLHNEPAPGMYLYPEPTFKCEDLNRYLSFYARHIRVFSSPTFSPHEPCLSTDFLLALQIATEYEHGALAPLLQKVVWFPPTWTDVKSRASLSAFVCLFVGKHIESFEFRAHAQGQEALYNASLQSNIKRISKQLKSLTIKGLYEAPLIHPYLLPFPWDTLEVLKISTYSSTLVQHLATLPRLRALEICDKELGQPTFHTLPRSQAPPCPTDFTNLRVLSLGTTCAEDRVWGMLNYLPSTNQLQQFEISSTSIIASCVCQDIIKAIALRCNPRTLTSIRLVDWDVPADDRDRQTLSKFDEEDQDIPVDITPLYPFDQLEVLVVSWFPDIRLSTQDASAIPWREQFPLATPHRRLHTLRVSNSPISSPSRVLAFLKSHFPRLEELDVFYADYDLETLSVLDRRWAAVLKGL
ncbi:hypothetical protein FA13DRAFT_1716588 [Coprinellus micaceus]|uniref:F-box domain-containing protein n=1 Tax=Coprinellus micaceus TaxID=71717 RepID=A0A4Y7SIU7_COPMI|nr:hypothetical protein FA13DRAFT_1716588 [Coprinellus micaceus]